MISRETSVHVACVVAGLTALGALTATGITSSFAGQILALGLFYGLTFGGAHLYFALRGEDGSVSVVARWRFLALVGVGILLAGLAIGAGEREVAGMLVQSLAGWAFLVVLVAYFLLEGVAGYREGTQGS